MLEYLDGLMLLALMGATLLGYPVAFTIAGVAILFAGVGWLSGVFDLSLLGALGQRFFGVMTNNVLIAIPMFIFMGVTLEKSGIAENLLEKVGALFGNFRGGLSVSVVLVGALLAASTGVVGATVVAMGLISLPAMLRAGAPKSGTAGTVCAAGTLGQIIPPSTLLIILSDVMSNAYQQAQFQEGKFNVETISVGQIFAAAILPGLLLVGVYSVYTAIRVKAARSSSTYNETRAELLRAVLPPIFLIVIVLGSILGGIATPTEAASMGAVGAIFLISAGKPKIFRWALAGVSSLALLTAGASLSPPRPQRDDAAFGDFLVSGVTALLIIVVMLALFQCILEMRRRNLLKPIMISTMVVTSMIFATILTASFFALVFKGLGGDAHIEQIIEAMPGGADGALLFVMMFIFVLGFFLDFVEISVIVLPLVVPALILMGHHPVWLSMLIALNLQTSFLTPPFGFSLFYLRSVAPKEISTGQIYAGVAPFIGLNILAMLMLWKFQIAATWLPDFIYGGQ